MPPNASQQMYPNMPVPPPTATPPKSGAGKTIALVISGVLIIGTLIFAFWAYGQMLSYKNNVDGHVAKAVALAKQETSTEKDAEFTEREKNPYKTFKGPATYGSIEMKYPRTWSAYVDETEKDTPINGYFHPTQVPGIESGTSFALRVQVLGTSYSETLAEYSRDIEGGTIKATAYNAPQVKKIDGIKLKGTIDEIPNATFILLPIRDKTLKIGTLSSQFEKDLNNIILKNIKFTP